MLVNINKIQNTGRCLTLLLVRQGEKEAARGVDGVAGSLALPATTSSSVWHDEEEGSKARRGSRRSSKLRKGSSKEGKGMRHGSTPWHRKSTRHLLRQASTQFERRRERERERERKCASTSILPKGSGIDEAPTHEASICVHTRSQHALRRQAQTRESHLTEDHGYWGSHPVTSSSLT